MYVTLKRYFMTMGGLLHSFIDPTQTTAKSVSRTRCSLHPFDHASAPAIGKEGRRMPFEPYQRPSSYVVGQHADQFQVKVK
jgi:hypothetical protein